MQVSFCIVWLKIQQNASKNNYKILCQIGSKNGSFAPILHMALGVKQDTRGNAHLDTWMKDNHTSIDWYMYCCKICTFVVSSKGHKRIGNLGKIVEINESKFGKTKYHKGRRVKEQWIFGGLREAMRTSFQHIILNLEGNGKQLHSTCFMQIEGFVLFLYKNCENQACNKCGNHLVFIFFQMHIKVNLLSIATYSKSSF